MAVKYANEILGMYSGDMSLEQINMLLNIRELEEIESLARTIYVFPPEVLLDAMDNGMGALEYCKLNNIDTSQYIGKLRKYQTTGVGFMYYSPRSILGDGVGLGKTVQMSSLLNVLRMKNELTKFIVAVETSAVGQVQSELMKFTGLNVLDVPSTAAKMRKVLDNTDWDRVDGIVIKHSTLRSDTFSSWLSQFIDDVGRCTLFNTFFLDESSVIKNDNTKMYYYTQNICNCMARVHCLNATAFEMYLMDIYNQLDMIAPNVLPKKWRIEKEYCKYAFKPYWVKVNGAATQKFSRQLDGYKNTEDFKQKLKLFYFGRPKSVALGEDTHEYKIYTVDPTKEQLVAIARKHRYNEVLNCPSLITDLKLPTDRKTVPKLDRLVEIINNEFDGCKVMVYCFHIEAQHAIKRELEAIGKKVVILNGETDDKDRKPIIDSFNEGDVDVIVTNIKKSLNLYNGDACIFYSIETNPAQLEQIHGRIDRNVDDKSKTYVLMVYANTPEYDYVTTVVKERGRNSRALTIDAKSTIDKFMDSIAMF